MKIVRRSVQRSYLLLDVVVVKLHNFVKLAGVSARTCDKS